MIQHRRRALVISGSYLLLGILYIAVSGRLATMVAPDIMELAHIEKIKGTLFVVLTAIGLFLFSQSQLKAVAREATDLLDHRDALLVSERRVIAGTIVVAGAYVIKRYLSSALAIVEKMKQAVSGTDAVKDVDGVTASFTKMEKEMQRIRDAGLAEIAGREQKIDLCTILESSIEIAGLHAVVRHCDIRLLGCKSMNVFVFPALIHPMVVNLLINAAEATGGRGKIEVHLRNDADEVTIEVHDNGPGILPSERAAVFAPFYTTKQHRAGLGLLSVHACVEAHGGRVELFSSHLGGSRFDVTLPGSVRVT